MSGIRFAGLLLVNMVVASSTAWANICPDTSYEVESLEIVQADPAFECLRITADNGGGCPDRVFVHVVNGCDQEVTFLPWTGELDGCASPGAVCDSPLPPDGVADFEVTTRRNDNGTSSDVTLDGEVAFAIRAELADGGTGEVQMLMNVVRRVYVEPPDEPPPPGDGDDMGGAGGDPEDDADDRTDSGGADGGRTDSADDDSGGCSTTKTRPGGSALAIVLAGLVAIRRRRRPARRPVVHAGTEPGGP